jgi:hypothetical protein
VTLPYDYSRCDDNVAAKCPFACARKQPGHPTRQVYSMFPGGDDCHGFIPEGGGEE